MGKSFDPIGLAGGMRDAELLNSTPRPIVSMSFQLAIPWRVALPQSPPPLHQPGTIMQQRAAAGHQKPANGQQCLNYLSHPRGQAQSDPNWRLRQAAVRTISRVWRKHPETLTILREFARSDQTSSLEAQRDALRSARVAEAAETPKRVWWVRWLMGDDLWSQLEIESPVRGWAVRQQAVQELARYWRQSPEVLEIVKQCAERDPDWTVRQVAIRELAQGWRRDPEVLVIVKTRITSDSHWRVRKTAV